MGQCKTKCVHVIYERIISTDHLPITETSGGKCVEPLYLDSLSTNEGEIVVRVPAEPPPSPPRGRYSPKCMGKKLFLQERSNEPGY